MTTFSISIRPCPKMWAKRSPFILLTSVTTTTRRSSSELTRSKFVNFPFRDVRECRCKELPESMRNRGYDCSLGMITVFILRDINPACSTAYRILHTKVRQKVMTDRLNLIMLDGQHRHAAGDILRKTWDQPWTAAHLLLESRHASRQSRY